MSEHVATLESWSVLTNMAAGGDHLAPYGSVWGHHKYANGAWIIPGTFASFNRETMSGVSLSGQRWTLDRASFRPNGNAPTLDAALDFIERCWVRRS